MFVFAGAALSAGSFSDAVGDANAAPDLTSVTVAEPVAGSLQVSVTVGNFESLPENSWLNLWFDVDSNPATGDSGDEALVRYVSNGTVEVYAWNGSQFVAAPTAGVTASFNAGALSLSIPRSVLGAATAFGLLAVSARSQTLGNDELIASDFAPDRGRSAFVGPASTAFSDPANDADAAPDISSIRVSDSKNGWVSFAITTPNYATFPTTAVLGLTIDADSRPSTGDAGAEVRITIVGGEWQLEKWSSAAKRWILDDSPRSVRVRNPSGVVTVEVRRDELGGRPRLGFAVVTAAVNGSADGLVGYDIAPDDAPFLAYQFTHKAALSLEAMRISATPARPRAGKPFVVTLAVRRSDTGKGVSSGTVVCHVLVNGKPVPTKGSIGGGAGRCALVVPPTGKGQLLRGSMIVRSNGKSVSADFGYLVG